MLYTKLDPVGAVITIVPVGNVQVGCTVVLAVGATGGLGIAFTVSVVAVEIQPVKLFFTVME